VFPAEVKKAAVVLFRTVGGNPRTISYKSKIVVPPQVYGEYWDHKPVSSNETRILNTTFLVAALPARGTPAILN
jgi:hypothetical protein